MNEFNIANTEKNCTAAAGTPPACNAGAIQPVMAGSSKLKLRAALIKEAVLPGSPPIGIKTAVMMTMRAV